MRGSAVAALLAALLLVASCSSSTATSAATATSAPSPTLVVVGGEQAAAVLGGQSLVGSWPQLFFREALPMDAVYVNLALAGFSVVGAAAHLQPSFAELHPDVVAIWTGEADAAAGVTSEEFRDGLAAVLDVATRSGRTDVLLATLPGGPVSYNDVIRALAAERSLRLVDVAGIVPAGTTDLSADQNRAVADAFITAYRGS